MKTIKIIDLLNKIANGEKLPTIIKYDGYIWTLRQKFNDYWNEEEYLFLRGFDDYDDAKVFLNVEVEIIEEDKKIEKISVKTNNHNVRKVANKINELIDEVNKLKEESK